MELNWLNTFITAAEEGNFRRAAERLHIAQSTVTLHIQNIETYLETQLFDRVGRTVQLNSTGLGFLHYAREIMNHYNESIEYVARRLQGYQETIHISVSTLVATTRLPAWIRKFQALSPETEFSIEVTGSKEVLESVMNLSCDIGISRIPSEHEQIQCRKLYDDPIVLVGPRGIRQTNTVDTTISYIFKKYLLFTYNHPLYWDNLLFQLRQFISNVRTLRVNKVHVSIEWIKEGMGVSFLPLSTVESAIDQGEIDLLPFPYFPLPCAHTYLLTQKNTTRAVDDLIHLVTEHEK
ncbi:HTH-type transcriptional regulator CitR [Alicyclobacillus acidoterrestris]|uniref:LysR family transcriptional regulator n=1 Tax=Alicyclobacillus suci TaxID=2816080 RepID=UPI0011942DF3|nr:LysR family transcriptional regulator [Alicyclobacillus suci]GEO25332.1 HTH-type transcriptional regulator CitR [Alicyclobacillus acidoterrestris]